MKVQLACMIALTSIVLSSNRALFAEQHPRLLVTPEKLSAIKKEIGIKGSHHQEAFEGIKTRVDSKFWYGSKGIGTDMKSTSRMAVEAACVYLITGDKQYSTLAHHALMNLNDPKATSLQKGSACIAYAFAYDWAWNGWSDEQRAAARAKLLPLYEYIQAESKGPPEYNKEAIYNGSEVCLTYALHLEQEKAVQLASGQKQLIAHMQRGYGDLGVYPEGGGYTAYAQAFAQPALAVMSQLGGEAVASAVRETMDKHPIWKWLMYAGTFQSEGYKSILANGVGYTQNYNEGWASATFGTVADADLPYYLWWYDRHMGKLAPGPIANKYDNDKGASPYALILYPIGVRAQNPTGVWPRTAIDQKMGYAFFRNRWQDENDILIGVTADTHVSARGWDQNEATQLQLAAHGSHYIVGPGKERTQKLYSVLWVQGKTKGTGGLKGGPLAFTPSMHGGYAIVSGGGQYTYCKKMDRHVLVDFSTGQDDAIFSTLDDVAASENNTYIWNANIDKGISIATQPKGFTLTGKNGMVSGWVLNPADAKVSSQGQNLQVSTSGTETKIWIVMYVTPGKTAPIAKIDGEGLASKIEIGGKKLSYESSDNRISCK